MARYTPRTNYTPEQLREFERDDERADAAADAARRDAPPEVSPAVDPRVQRYNNAANAFRRAVQAEPPAATYRGRVCTMGRPPIVTDAPSWKTATHRDWQKNYKTKTVCGRIDGLLKLDKVRMADMGLDTKPHFVIRAQGRFYAAPRTHVVKVK